MSLNSAAVVVPLAVVVVGACDHSNHTEEEDKADAWDDGAEEVAQTQSRDCRDPLEAIRAVVVAAAVGPTVELA